MSSASTHISLACCAARSDADQIETEKNFWCHDLATFCSSWILEPRKEKGFCTVLLSVSASTCQQPGEPTFRRGRALRKKSVRSAAQFSELRKSYDVTVCPSEFFGAPVHLRMPAGGCGTIEKTRFFLSRDSTRAATFFGSQLALAPRRLVRMIRWHARVECVMCVAGHRGSPMAPSRRRRCLWSSKACE